MNDGAVILKRYHNNGSKGWKLIRGMPPIVSFEVRSCPSNTDYRQNVKTIWAINLKVGGMAMPHKYLLRCLVKPCPVTGLITLSWICKRLNHCRRISNNRHLSFMADMFVSVSIIVASQSPISRISFNMDHYILQERRKELFCVKRSRIIYQSLISVSSFFS